MLENLTERQRKLLIIIGVVVAVLVMFFIYQNAGAREYIEQDDSQMMVNNTDEKSRVKDTEFQDDKEHIIVHIAGEVISPGIVSLNEGGRIEDAIKMAGGLTENADISDVNLAYVLDDGVKIIIPKKDAEDENKEIIKEDAGKGIILEDGFEVSKKAELININKATQADLEKLSGVGASLAEKIVDYRNKNGKFSSIEDIKNVSGIGESKFNSIKDFICVK